MGYKFWFIVIFIKIFVLFLGLYGTKEELEDTEDFFPFVYVTINIPTWILYKRYKKKNIYDHK